MLPIRMLVQGYGGSHRSRRMAPPQEEEWTEWKNGCWLACDSRHLILFSCSLSPPTYLAIKSTLESRAGRRCDTSMARHKGEPACSNCFLRASGCCCLCATLFLVLIWALSIDTEHFCILPEIEVLPLLGSVREQPFHHPASSGDGSSPSSDLREDEGRVPLHKDT